MIDTKEIDIKENRCKNICKNCYLYLENNLLCCYDSANFVIVFDLLYDRKFRNDFSKPRFVLVYDVRHNNIIFTKFNIETMNLIWYDMTKIFKLENIKNKSTFFDFVEDKFIPDSIKRNCGYNPRKKLLYTIYDKDNKTIFAYYKNNIIDAFRFIDNKPFYIRIKKLPNLINSYEELKEFIKTNKALIDEKFNKELNRYREQKELERVDDIINAINDFADHDKEIGK